MMQATPLTNTGGVVPPQTNANSPAMVGKAMRAALTSSSQIQSAYHSGVRNMFLVSSTGFALAAFLFATKAQGATRLVIASLVAAIIVFSATYGMCVSRWHREAVAILHAALEVDDDLPAPVARIAGDMVRRSWEKRVHVYAAIEMIALLAILVVIFSR